MLFLGKHHFGCLATVLPDLGAGLTRSGKVAKPSSAAGGGSGPYRLSVQPVSESVGLQALRAAKRVATAFETKYYASGMVADRLKVNPRILGRITGNMWAREGGSSAAVVRGGTPAQAIHESRAADGSVQRSSAARAGNAVTPNPHACRHGLPQRLK